MSQWQNMRDVAPLKMDPITSDSCHVEGSCDRSTNMKIQEGQKGQTSLGIGMKIVNKEKIFVDDYYNQQGYSQAMYHNSE